MGKHNFVVEADLCVCPKEREHLGYPLQQNCQPTNILMNLTNKKTYHLIGFFIASTKTKAIKVVLQPLLQTSQFSLGS